MAQQVSVSLDEKHIKIVERYGRKIGVSKFSVALQAIIHQFDQTQKAASPAAEQTPEPAPAVTAG